MSSTSISGSDISIRLFKRKDMESLLSLYKDVWPNRGIDEGYWNWKYQDNPFGKPLILVAVKEEKIVGQEALWPMPLSVDGVNQLSFQSVDSMVHPDYRGRGIFNNLITRSMEECSTLTSPIVFGFPNRSSHKIYTKFGWLSGGSFHRFIKILNWQDVFNSRITAKYLKWASNLAGFVVSTAVSRFSEKRKIKGVEVKEELEPLKIFEEIWLEYYQQSGKPTAINKSLEYLNWRYKNKPGSNCIFLSLRYKASTLGFGVIKKDTYGVMKRVSLGEFVLLDKAFTSGFLSEIFELLKRKECSTFEYNVWNSLELEGILKSLGFIRRSDEPPVIFKVFKDFPADKINWHISGGDNESF
ncbi:MAG: hypothetical protein DDT42_00967 [candidate division WS2 bacterium]|uniref:N-acetyltransferase domain-containing protein n=1 Tax=Psychracetigena formicireducens TaxID=2986056 RepID=A0A9E2BGI5_PSYF1|nr:hypothetical protein [Candidatus Psychracetigena formicireducens]